jgi:hypothetical protein
MTEKTKSTRKTKKDRVLQARIPEQLDEQLRDRAEDLGLSVSTIVRNVLLQTFNLVEGVVSDSAQIARVIQGKPASRTTSPTGDTHAETEADIVGWQETILNRNGVCEQCNSILAKGEKAAVGLPVQTRPVLLCSSCLTDLSGNSDKPSTENTGASR